MKFSSNRFLFMAFLLAFVFCAGIAPLSAEPKPRTSSAHDDEIEDMTRTQGEEIDETLFDNTGKDSVPDYVEKEGVGKVEVDEDFSRKIRDDASSETSATNRKDARTMTLAIPAPRGQIVDRFGYPLAQNVLSYQIALKFGQFEDESPENIVSYGKRCIKDAQKLAGSLWGNISNEEKQEAILLSHYKNRRWLPLSLTKGLSQKEMEKLPKPLPKGLEILPIYKRVYPNGKTAAHLLGYSGLKGQLPTGPINHLDPLWELSEGRSGFEERYDKQLTGRVGIWRLMFDEQGNKILDELSVRPKPGGTVVTTLNLEWQKLAEKILSKRCKRGAFVVIDVETGEVVVLASYPSFDPNGYVPSMSLKDHQKLQKDPDNPLFSRAFQGVYPPASTFKSVVAMSALSSGLINPSTTIYCPGAIKVGNITFKNWTPVPEGDINVCRALARSTNTFFYQVAQRMLKKWGGLPPFFSMARKLGLGQKTGLPINDSPGIIPDDEWMRRRGQTRASEGDFCNWSIGQGVIGATPLQVAQMMAGIARGDSLPRLHLIKQIQDMDGNVILASHREERTSLYSESYAASVVRKGLYDVVYSGTGGKARLSYTTLCGKTGTGQYGKDKYVGWFAGFVPYDRPKFAFAALYEGGKGETKVGGGPNAAPMVSDFFEALKSEIKSIITPVAAEVVEDDSPVTPKAPGVTTETVPAVNPAQPQPGTEVNIPVLPEIQEIDDSSENESAAREVEVINEDGD